MQVDGFTLYPAAGMLVMVIEAAKQLADHRRRIDGYSFKDVVLQNSLDLSSNTEDAEVELVIRPSQIAPERDISWLEFRIVFYKNNDWVGICEGNVRMDYAEDLNEVDEITGLDRWKSSLKDWFRNGTRRCIITCDAKQFYDFIEETGFGFGPSFHTMDQVRYGNENEATAQIDLRRWTLKQDERHTHSHVIHPTTLDGIFQVAFPALSSGIERTIPSFVPSRIGGMWISSDGLSEQASNPIRAYAKASFRGYREAGATIITMNQSESRILAWVELEHIAVGNKSALSSSIDTTRRLCHGFDQKPDPDIISGESILQYCQENVQSDPSPVDFYRDLRLSIFFFISRTVEQFRSEDGKKLAPHLQRYMEWMEQQIAMANDGRNPYMSPDWQQIVKDTDFLTRVCERVKTTNKMGKFFIEVGESLEEILSGKAQALDLFFQGSLVEDYYREAAIDIHGMRTFAVYLDLLGHKQPGMKILEIGAGVGSATVSVLKRLTDDWSPRFAHYTYTDISPSFSENAQEIFKNYRNKMSFSLLDIEKDPLQQGFEAEAYDLIVAAHVFHATGNIVNTLSNTRKLLKPGGKLVFWEQTEPHVLPSTFAFGLLEGWWRAIDNHRSFGPCMTKERWNQLLLECGFSGSEIVIPDYGDAQCHEQSAIISTVLNKNLQKPIPPKTLIIVPSESDTRDSNASFLLVELSNMGCPACEVVSLEQATSIKDLGNTFCISLLDMMRPFLRHVDSSQFLLLQRLLTSVSGMIWMTRSGTQHPDYPSYSMATGFSRVIRQEISTLKFVTIALELGQEITIENSKEILQVYLKTLAMSTEEYEPEYVQQEGRLCVGRIIEAGKLNQGIAAEVSEQKREHRAFGDSPPLELNIGSPGLLDTLEFRQDKDTFRPLDPDEIEIEVKACGVNFRDCFIALGRIAGSSMGSECSGVVRRAGDRCGFRPGDRVCTGILGTYQTLVRCNEVNATRIPDNMTFVEAAAIPTTCATVCYALEHVGQIKKGESVLIHSGAGGTGQAAIQLAQLFDARIYVTVSSAEKKKLVMDLYDIPQDHIFYSRNTSFVQGIKEKTLGRGVDICLNSLSGDALVQSFECMAPFGRFLEIGKKDIFARRKLPMFPFAKNISFHAIDLSQTIVEKPRLLRRIRESATFKKLKPARPLHVYGIGELEDAFRYLQGGKNTGKIVIEMRHDDHVPVSPHCVVQTILDCETNPV